MIRVSTEMQTSKPPRAVRHDQLITIHWGELRLQMSDDEAASLMAEITRALGVVPGA